jgi:hypothetical protein
MFNVSEITKYLNIALIVLFVVVLVNFVLFFLRGLLRGWRYGTYRVIAFAVLITIALLTLGPITDLIGNWDMSSFGFPQVSIQTNNGTATTSFGTPYGVGSYLIEQYIESYGTTSSPETVAAYALSLAKSIVMVIVLGLDGLLLATLGNLFVMILWHIAFIHIIPKDKREASKHQGRLISAFEELVVGVVISAMMLFPFSSLVNSFAYGWNTPKTEEEKSQIAADNTTYDTIQKVVDTYNDSLFSKVFFEWSKNSDGLSFDMALTNYFTKGNYSDASVGAIGELANLVRTGSYLVEGGLIGKSSIDKTSIALFAVSEYAPAVLRCLAKSNMLTGLLPYALQVVTNMPEVAKYLKTDSGIDFTSKDYNYAVTLDKLATIYQGLIENKTITGAILDESGNLKSPQAIAQGFFTPEAKATMDATIKAFDDVDLRMFSTVIQSAIYVQCCNAYKDLQANPTKYADELTILDFFPQIASTFDSKGASDGGGNGVPDQVPEEFTSIKWGSEILSLYDSICNISVKDTALIGTLASGLGQSTYSIDTKELLKGVVNNLDAYGSSLFGVSVTSSTNGLKGEETTAETKDPCLLDSTLVERALPKVLKLTAKSINTSFNLTGENALDLSGLDSTLFVDDITSRIEKVKAEFQNLYTVISDMVSTPEAKALLLDLDNLPGLYFDPNGKFLGADKGLISGFTAALKDLDKSTIANAILPKVFEGFLEGDSSPLESLGLGDLKLDFSKNVGTNLASLLEIYSENQGVVSYLMSNTSTISAANAGSVIKSLLSFTSTNAQGQKTSQLTNILKGLVTNEIISPIDATTNQHDNSNIKSILTTLLGKMDIGTDNLNLGSDLETEMESFVGVLQVISDDDLFSKISAFSSGSHDLSVLSSIDFTALFTEIQKSAILSSVLGDYLDKTVLTNIGYLSDASASGAKFANVTDWAKEGAALDALIKAANDIGDLDNIDYFKSDPQAITSIIKALAGSQIFQGKDTKGNATYVFPSYMANKLASSFKEDASYGAYFADADAGTSLTDNDFDTFKSSFTGIASGQDVASQVSAWTTTDGEAEKIGAILTSVLRVGGFTFISDSTDWRTVNRANMSVLLDAVAASDSFGPILTYHLYDKVGSTLQSSAPAFQDSNNAAVLAMDAAGRKEEVAYLGAILDAVVDPSYGLLDANGKLQNTSIVLKNVSADFFVDPLLTSMASSRVFNTQKIQSDGTKAEMTAFEEEYSSILVSSSLYATKAEADTVVKGLRVTNSGEIDQGATLTAWKTEIGHLCKTLSAVQDLGLDITSLDFTSLFSSSNSEAVNEANRVKVETALLNFNKCQTLYPTLPTKLKEAVSKIDGASTYELDKANFTYNGSKAYEDSEITTLTYLLKDSSSLKGLDTSNLSSIDVTGVSNVLADLVKSKIFNTTSDGSDSVAVKLVAKVLLAGDSLKDVYFYAENPKDQAAVTAAEYTTSSEKALYLSKKYFALGSSDYNVALINGDTGSLKSVLTAVKTGSISTSITNNNTSSLSETDLTTLLSALNSSKLYQDTVPNLLAKFLSGSLGSSISNIDMSLANPYYCYYKPASFTYGTTLIPFTYDVSGKATFTPVTLASYENTYDEEEIATLASLIHSMNDSTVTALLSDAKLTKMDITTEDVTTINGLLKLLSSSYVFNYGGPYGGSNVTNSSLGVTNDLSVFEQAYFNFLDKSGLSSRAYDVAYDYQIPNANTKLYTAIKAFQADVGVSSPTGGTLHSGNWDKEIDALTVEKTSGVESGGLLYEALANSEISTLLKSSGGSNFSTSGNLASFKSVSPSAIKVILTEMNKLDLVHDAVPYSVASLVEDSLNFKTYSTLSFPVASLSGTHYDSESLGIRGHYNGLAVTLASEVANDAITVYAYDTTLGNKVAVSLTKDTNGNITGHTSGSLTYVFDMGMAYPYYFSVDVTGSTLSSLSYSYNTSNYILSQAEFQTPSKEDASKTAIDVITDFASSIYDSTAKKYVDFGDKSQVTNFFATKTDGLPSVLRYISDPNGFYTRNFYNADTYYSVASSSSYAFASRDIVFRKMLSFDFAYNGGTYPMDFGKYLAESGAEPATYEGAKAIFTAAGYSSTTEGNWLSANLTNLATSEGLYQSVGKTTYGSHSLDQVHSWVEAFVSTAAGSQPSLALENTLSAAETGSSLLGKYLAAGQAQRFVKAELDYLKGGTYFDGMTTALSRPASYGTNRSTLLPSGFAPSFYANDFALLTSTNGRQILHDYFDIASYLKLSTAISSGTMTISTSARDTVVADLAALDAYLSAAENGEHALIQTLYLGTTYDYYLNRSYFHGVAIGGSEVDGFYLPGDGNTTHTLGATGSAILTA